MKKVSIDQHPIGHNWTSKADHSHWSEVYERATDLKNLGVVVAAGGEGLTSTNARSECDIIYWAS